MKPTLAVSLLLVTFLLIITNCNSVEPPSGLEITLKLEDASCTEAWIKLTTTNLQLPTTIVLEQDNNARDTINLSKADTLLYIDSLLPNQTYSFVTSHPGLPGVSSNSLSVTTMDTTSHDFTFETFTFGGNAGSCTLYDVAIINENNIWAVGEIYVADTSINGNTLYNAVHWDGSEWELERIKTNACGGVEYPPIKAIFAFSEDDILFAHIDGSITHYNGVEFINNCSLITQLNGSANKIWGLSKNDYYVVSGNGFIAHYNGQSWQRIESGTELDIYDIWGDYNNRKSTYEILLVAAQHLVGPDRKILTIKNNSVEELSTSNISVGSLDGVWFITGRKYYVVGNGIYKKNDLTEVAWDATLGTLTPYYSYAVRGSSNKNIFICGSYGEVLHYNGFSWKSFRNTPGFFQADFYNIDVKNEVVVTVGQRYNSAFITVGKSQ